MEPEFGYRFFLHFSPQNIRRPNEEIYSLDDPEKGVRERNEATVDFTTFFSAPREEYCASSCTFLEPSYIDFEIFT